MTTRVRPPLQDPSPPALTDVMLTETNVSLDGHFSHPTRQINSDPSKVASPDPMKDHEPHENLSPETNDEERRSRYQAGESTEEQTRDGDGTEEWTRQDEEEGTATASCT